MTILQISIVLTLMLSLTLVIVAGRRLYRTVKRGQESIDRANQALFIAELRTMQQQSIYHRMQAWPRFRAKWATTYKIEPIGTFPWEIVEGYYKQLRTLLMTATSPVMIRYREEVFSAWNQAVRTFLAINVLAAVNASAKSLDRPARVEVLSRHGKEELRRV